MTRSPQEILSDHLAAVEHGDIATIVEDYREDAVLLTSQGALEGRSGLEMFYTQALAMLPRPKFGVESAIYGGDALLVQWTLISPAGRVNDGVDTFVFADGAIRLQTSVFTVQPIESADSPAG